MNSDLPQRTQRKKRTPVLVDVATIRIVYPLFSSVILSPF